MIDKISISTSVFTMLSAVTQTNEVVQLALAIMGLISFVISVLTSLLRLYREWKQEALQDGKITLDEVIDLADKSKQEIDSKVEDFKE